jgi:HSP20 family molecular chaperone IbpA
MSYKTRAQVEEYIEDFLLKSATFTLEKGHNISTQKGKNTTEYYYYEKSDDQQIFHLIFAQDGSDAGNYYNDSTLNFIEKHFQNITSLTNYDVIETLKDCFVDLSKDILEKTEKPLTKENFDNSEERIKLNITNSITLKKSLTDELFLSSLRANGFEPTYNYYKKDNSIILRIEIPGNFTIKSGLFNKGEFNIIQITGNKKKDKEPADEKDIIDNKREYGDFSFNIALEAAKYPLKRKQPKQDSKKGIIILEYELDDEMNEATFEDQEDV